jgi:hypothetical protein
MIKSIVLHDIPVDAVPAMERWYHRDHSPEISRRYGPRLARHESYLSLDAPLDARAYGFHNRRVTECFWREPPLAGRRGTLASRRRRCGRPWHRVSSLRSRPRTSSVPSSSPRRKWVSAGISCPATRKDCFTGSARIGSCTDEFLRDLRAYVP